GLCSSSRSRRRGEPWCTGGAVLPETQTRTQTRGDTAMEMQLAERLIDSGRYARCVANSKRSLWDIDTDVIRGRTCDFTKRFLPDGLARVDRLDFLDADEQRLLSQIQG